ncbi:MAG TPA: 30S ribosomal protein S21 [Candidatus Marinimicrobia bacterium]|nr:30S ribosomal protein S21 [Candidatus Neomarinimicrobiota bacterium]
MVQVTVRSNEPLEKALRRFKKKFEKAGILKDLKKNAHYTKPSVEKRIKQSKARKRNARDERYQRR